jgi:hypothetical protein
MVKKFEYTLEDCACEYCLYYEKATQSCGIDVCCCLEEKRAALARLRIGNQEVRKCAG